MTFQTFSSYLEKIEATPSRNQITEFLAELFNKLPSQEIEPACWLLLGRIVPAYEGVEFQFAEKMMIRAIARAFEVDPELILSEYKKGGDLATVAEHFAGLHQKKTSEIAV